MCMSCYARQAAYIILKGCRADLIQILQLCRLSSIESEIWCKASDVQQDVVCHESFCNYVLVGYSQAFLVRLRLDSSDSVSNYFVMSFNNGCLRSDWFRSSLYLMLVAVESCFVGFKSSLLVSNQMLGWPVYANPTQVGHTQNVLGLLALADAASREP